MMYNNKLAVHHISTSKHLKSNNNDEGGAVLTAHECGR